MRLFIQLGLDNPLETHLTVATQPPFRLRSETASKAALPPSLRLSEVKLSERRCHLSPGAALPTGILEGVYAARW
jgi:hypothetical protein